MAQYCKLCSKHEHESWPLIPGFFQDYDDQSEKLSTPVHLLCSLFHDDLQLLISQKGIGVFGMKNFLVSEIEKVCAICRKSDSSWKVKCKSIMCQNLAHIECLLDQDKYIVCQEIGFLTKVKCHIFCSAHKNQAGFQITLEQIINEIQTFSQQFYAQNLPIEIGSRPGHRPHIMSKKNQIMEEYPERANSVSSNSPNGLSFVSKKKQNKVSKKSKAYQKKIEDDILVIPENNVYQNQNSSLVHSKGPQQQQHYDYGQEDKQQMQPVIKDQLKDIKNQIRSTKFIEDDDVNRNNQTANNIVNNNVQVQSLTKNISEVEDIIYLESGYPNYQDDDRTVRMHEWWESIDELYFNIITNKKIDILFKDADKEQKKNKLHHYLQNVVDKSLKNDESYEEIERRDQNLRLKSYYSDEIVPFKLKQYMSVVFNIPNYNGVAVLATFQINQLSTRFNQQTVQHLPHVSNAQFGNIRIISGKDIGRIEENRQKTLRPQTQEDINMIGKQFLQTIYEQCNTQIFKDIASMQDPSAVLKSFAILDHQGLQNCLNDHSKMLAINQVLDQKKQENQIFKPMYNMNSNHSEPDQQFELDELALNVIVLKHAQDSNNELRQIKKKILESYNKKKREIQTNINKRNNIMENSSKYLNLLRYTSIKKGFMQGFQNKEFNTDTYFKTSKQDLEDESTIQSSQQFNKKQEENSNKNIKEECSQNDQNEEEQQSNKNNNDLEYQQQQQEQQQYQDEKIEENSNEQNQQSQQSQDQVEEKIEEKIEEEENDKQTDKQQENQVSDDIEIQIQEKENQHEQKLNDFSNEKQQSNPNFFSDIGQINNNMNSELNFNDNGDNNQQQSQEEDFFGNSMSNMNNQNQSVPIFNDSQIFEKDTNQQQNSKENYNNEQTDKYFQAKDNQEFQNTSQHNYDEGNNEIDQTNDIENQQQENNLSKKENNYENQQVQQQQQQYQNQEKQEIHNSSAQKQEYINNYQNNQKEEIEVDKIEIEVEQNQDEQTVNEKHITPQKEHIVQSNEQQQKENNQQISQEKENEGSNKEQDSDLIGTPKDEDKDDELVKQNQNIEQENMQNEHQQQLQQGKLSSQKNSSNSKNNQQSNQNTFLKQKSKILKDSDEFKEDRPCRELNLYGFMSDNHINEDEEEEEEEDEDEDEGDDAILDLDQENGKFDESQQQYDEKEKQQNNNHSNKNTTQTQFNASGQKPQQKKGNLKKKKKKCKKNLDIDCAICFNHMFTDHNPVVYCSQCSISFHKQCYGIKVIPTGKFLCDYCQYFNSKKRRETIHEAKCALCCHLRQLPLKRFPIGDPENYNNKWFHLSCLFLENQCKLVNGGEWELKPDLIIDQSQPPCYFCDSLKGLKIPCCRSSEGQMLQEKESSQLQQQMQQQIKEETQNCNCNFWAHPICAYLNGYQIQIEGGDIFDPEKIEFSQFNIQIYCQQHTDPNHSIQNQEFYRKYAINYDSYCQYDNLEEYIQSLENQE